MLKILIVSGEPSGDFLGLSLIRGLKKLIQEQTSKQISFQGIGGPLMESEGFVSLIEQSRISKMGIIDILLNISDLLSDLNKITNYCIAWNPDLIITIDSPEFSFRLNKKVRKSLSSTPIIHYVMPTVWAWRPRRLQRISNFVDHILALFPFEPNLAREKHISCDFVGHPIVSKKTPASQDIAMLRKTLGVKMDAPLMAVLPGSRISEVKYNLPIFLETIKLVAATYTDLIFVIPAVNGMETIINNQVSVFQKSTGLPVLTFDQKSMVNASEFERMKFSLFRTAAIALATSGTVVLELARMGVPMVVGYRSHYFNELLIKLLVLTERANLIDIIAGTTGIPEFLFGDCKPQKLFEAIKEILNDPTVSARQLELSRKVIKDLGFGNISPGDRAAASVLSYLQNHDKKLPFF